MSFARNVVMASMLLATVPVPGQSSPSKDEIDKIKSLYQKARDHFMKSDYAKSNETYVQILAVLPVYKDGPYDPDRSRVLYDIAGNHALLGNKKEALEHLGKAVDAGYWDHDYLKVDPSLAALRQEKDFPTVVDRCRRGFWGIAFGSRDLKGNELKKEDYAGKVLIVDVWGTWCPPCREEIPSFVKLQDKYRDRGLRIIGLTWERGATDDATKKRVESFAAANKINYPLVLLNPRLSSMIRPPVRAYPTTFFVGADGLIADRIEGLHDYGSLEQKALRLLDKAAASAKGD